MNITDKFVEGFVEACYKSGLTEKQACTLMDYYVTQNNVEGIEKSADANGLIKALLAVLGVGGLAYGADYLGTTNSPIGTWLRNNLGAGNWGIHKWVANALGGTGSSGGLAAPKDTKMYKAPKAKAAPAQSASLGEAAGKLALESSTLGNKLINLPWKAKKTVQDTWNDTKHIVKSTPKVVGKAVADTADYAANKATSAADWTTDKIKTINSLLP